MYCPVLCRRHVNKPIKRPSYVKKFCIISVFFWREYMFKDQLCTWYFFILLIFRGGTCNMNKKACMEA